LPDQLRFCYNNIIEKQKYFSHSLSLEPTADRRASLLLMTSTLNLEAQLALVSGG
jgi:hypothetical protein